ncbi:hypothetical protein ACFX15_002883 [Malus domestica]
MISIGSRRRGGDGERLQWIMGEASSHMAHQVLGGDENIFGPTMLFFGLRQNANQLGNVVIEDVPEEILNNNRPTILGGVEGSSSLSTDELHGGTCEQVGDVIHSMLNF